MYYRVKKDVLVAVLQFLQKQPYEQVRNLISALQQTSKEIKETADEKVVENKEKLKKETDK